MTEFQPYIVRKQMGDTAFTFLVGDPVGQSWYDTPNSAPLTAEQIHGLPFVPSRTGEINWLEMRVLRDHIALPGFSRPRIRERRRSASTKSSLAGEV